MNERLKRRFIWPAILISCLPLLFIIQFPAKISASSAALYLSALAGYVGVVFLLWMYMLGAKSAMGVLFKDLAPVLSIHKDLGKWGSIAFLLHPLLVAYSYFEVNLRALTYVAWPDITTAMERHVTLGRVAFFIIIIVWLTSKVFRNALGFRAWKYLHYFAYVSLPFALLHVPELGSQYIGHDIVRGYYWTLVGVFALFSLFRIGGWLNLDRKTYTIASHTQLSEQDFMLVVQPRTKHWLKPSAGQYVYLKQGIISEDHPFSLTYYDKNTGNLTLIYRVFGSYTKYLSTLAPGKNVSLMGPFGSFTTDLPADSTQPVVYIAGGVGITPFAQRIIDESHARPQILFAANRTHTSDILIPSLRQILGNRLVSIYSREAPLNQYEEQGHINEDVILRHIGAPQAYHFYLCGPQDFVKECERILKNIGVPAKQVKVEEFSW